MDITTEKFRHRSYDGAMSDVNFFIPSAENNLPVVVLFPAMGVKATYYTEFAKLLAAQHLIVCCTELRSNGSSDVRPSRKVNFGYFEMLWNDYYSIIDLVRKKYPNHPIYLLGHSLGGQLAALYAAMNQESIDGLILVASGSVYYRAFQFPKSIGLLLSTQLAWIISKILGSFPGKYLGFGGHEARGVMRDWAYQARTGHYKLANSDNDFEMLLSEVQKPLLAISIANDKLAPSTTVDHLCSKLPSSTITRWHYESDQALKKIIDHFNWVKHPEFFIKRIVSWISSQPNLQEFRQDD